MSNRVKALADIAIDLALFHHLEVLQDVVAFIPLRQPVKAPVIFRRRFITKEGFIMETKEFRVIAPVVNLAFQQWFRRVGGKVSLQIGLLLAWQRHVTWQTLRQQPQVGQP